MKKLSTLIVTSCLSIASHSGDFTGKILKMEFGPVYGDIIHIDIEGEQRSRPTCANNQYGFDFSFDSSSASGKQVFSALLAAQRADAIVTIHGSGYCTVNTTEQKTEDINFIQSK